MSILLPISWLLSTGLLGYSLLKISILGFVYFSSTTITSFRINQNLLLGFSLLLIPGTVEVIRYGTVENFLLTGRILGCLGLFILSKSYKYKRLNLISVWWVMVLIILFNIYQHPPILTGKLGLQGFLGRLSVINPPQGFVGLFAALSFYVAGLKRKPIWCLFFLFILVLSNSRAAILAVILSLPLLVPLCYKFKKIYLTLLATVALSLLAIFLNYESELAYITSGRSVIYSAFVKAIEGNWLFGVGSVSNIPSVSLLFENALAGDFDDGRGNAYTFGADGFVAPHNDYLLILFRGGIFAFIGFYYLTKKYLFESFIGSSTNRWYYTIFVFWVVFIFFENAITWPPFYIYLGILKREGPFVDKKTKRFVLRPAKIH